MNFFVFEDEGYETIFYHVLCSVVIKNFHDMAPLFSHWYYIFYQLYIFLLTPFLVYYAVIQVVKPPFFALFPQTEKFILRFYKHLYRYIIPFRVSQTLVNKLN